MKKIKNYLFPLILVVLTYVIFYVLYGFLGEDKIGLISGLILIILTISSTIFSIITLALSKSYNSILYLYVCFLGLSFIPFLFNNWEFIEIISLPVLFGLILLFLHIRRVKGNQ